MKIVFIISTLNVGGAESVLSMVANYMSQMGHEIIIITASKEKPFFELNQTIKLIQLGRNKPDKGILNRIKHIPLLINDLKNSIKKCNPDIVISFIWNMATALIISLHWLVISDQ